MATIINTTDATFDQDVIESSLPVLVDFWATWCAPCKAIAPVLEALSAEFDGRLNIVKVDVTNCPATAERFSVRNIPTLLLFKNGEVVDQTVGASPRSVLTAFVEKNL